MNSYILDRYDFIGQAIETKKDLSKFKQRKNVPPEYREFIYIFDIAVLLDEHCRILGEHSSIKGLSKDLKYKEILKHLKAKIARFLQRFL